MEIRPGEIFGLLGPNGAGKTTLIKCLSTLLIPSGGHAWINGYELTRQDNEIRATLGCMLMGDRGLYWKLTGRENLIFFGALYKLSVPQRQKRAQQLIEGFNLEKVADRTVETYSSGQKMMLAFAKSLINDAPVVILDEPTNTLDVPSAQRLRTMVRNLSGEGRTIIYATHLMSEAESLCQRVAIIDRGRVLALDTVVALKESLRREEVIHVEGVIPEKAYSAVNVLPGVLRTCFSPVNGSTRLTIVGRRERVTLLPQLIQTLTFNNCVLQKISPEEVTLEDVFLAYTGRSLAEGTEES